MQIYKDPSDIVILACQADDFRHAGIKAVFNCLDQATFTGDVKGFGLTIDGSYAIYQHFTCVASDAETTRAWIDRVIEANYSALIQRILALRYGQAQDPS